MPLIRKTVKLPSETWEKLIRYAKLPENQRPTESQAGIIIKEFFDNLEKERDNEKTD